MYVSTSEEINEILRMNALSGVWFQCKVKSLALVQILAFYFPFLPCGKRPQVVDVDDYLEWFRETRQHICLTLMTIWEPCEGRSMFCFSGLTLGHQSHIWKLVSVQTCVYWGEASASHFHIAVVALRSCTILVMRLQKVLGVVGSESRLRGT
jgi:hypothetical protein